MALSIILFVAIFCVFLFAGAKVAFVSATELRFDAEKKKGLISKMILFFLRNLRSVIATISLGQNLFLIVSVVCITLLTEECLPFRTDVISFWGVLLGQLVFSSFIIILVSDFISRGLFGVYPIGLLRFFAMPLYAFYWLLYPVERFISLLSYFILRIFGVKVQRESQVRAFENIYLLQSDPIKSKVDNEFETEIKIFQNALDFSNIKVRDCMVHRTEIVAVDVETSLDELKNLFVESGLSKIIVYKGNIDNVIGYIHSSEMFRDPLNWRKNVKEVPIVPETMSAHKLMKLFMQQKKTIAVVVDEFGGTSGIVSLEDLVEEIFGDIEDEHDNSTYICKSVGEHEYLLSARLEIEKVNETLGLDLPESTDYVTVGGLILSHYQSFPKMHEEITIGKYLFRIIKMKATKIELVRLKVLE